MGRALTQRGDRLSATVLKRKTVITRPRTYLDTHHMSLGPAQRKSLPLGPQLSQGSRSLRILCFSCILVGQLCHLEGFHVSYCPARDISHRATGQSITSTCMDWPGQTSKRPSSAWVSPVAPSLPTPHSRFAFLFLGCSPCTPKSLVQILPLPRVQELPWLNHLPTQRFCPSWSGVGP